MDIAKGDNLLLECFADKVDFRFQVLVIRMDFVKGDNLSSECFVVRVVFRFQVLAIGIDFVEGDNLLLECFLDGADFMFHVLASSCWEIYKVTSKIFWELMLLRRGPLPNFTIKGLKA